MESNAVFALEAWQEELHQRTVKDRWCLECASDILQYVEAYSQIYETLEPR